MNSIFYFLFEATPDRSASFVAKQNEKLSLLGDDLSNFLFILPNKLAMLLRLIRP